VGLDLVVEGCAKPTHEMEWHRLLERAFADSQLSEAEIARFEQISVPGYERIGAPRVGFDAARMRGSSRRGKRKRPRMWPLL
jgi:hypothetical protein